MSKPITLVLFAALLAGGCASTPSRDAAPAVAAEPAPPPAPAGPAADDNLNAVLWTQASVERDLVYREVYRSATEQLVRAVKDRRWEALPEGERKTPVKGLKPAVILDIDETVLDNSPYQARLVRDGLSFDEFTWAEWCREEKAEPVPGALAFTKEATRLGVTVFYLSNRARDLREPTIANLRAKGFPVPDNEEVFLGLGTVVQGCEQDGSEKGCRRELISRKYRVLMQVGDQLGDFVDVLANTPEGRRQAIEPYMAWVGERWFMLPNPTYGSWEPATFNNDWRSPIEVRRKAKHDALNVAN